MSVKKRIDKYIETHIGDIIEDIKMIVSFESVYGNQEAIQGALDFMLERARDMGFITKTTAEKDVGIIEIGHGTECVGILVHVDVVDIGDPDKWTHPPFECTIEDGQIWGRGTIDDKAAAIICLYALKALVDLEIPLSKRVQLIVGTSEESEWIDMKHYKDQFTVPDYGFTPDGDFPIYNAEKGYSDVKLVFTEPEIDKIIKLNSGGSPNSIPSKAVIQIEGEEELIFDGQASHSSAPESGDNAIEKMCKTLQDRKEFNFIRFVNDVLADDFYTKHLGIDEDVEDILGSSSNISTAVPTVLILLDNAVLLNTNIRQRIGVTRDGIKKAFAKYAQEYGFSFFVSECLDGLMVDENLEPLQRMRQTMDIYGIPGEFSMERGSSYAKSVPNFVAWGPFDHNEVNTCHTEDEHISIDNVILAAKIYTYWLANENSV